MASALAAVPLADRVVQPRFRMAFNRFPGAPVREREWWFEPEFCGVYRLASVNGLRPPYFWPSASGNGGSEWLLSGRVFVREDRSWVVRLASGARPASVNDTHVTIMQGSWAPAMTGQLAVRTSDGYAAAWMANGRSILMRGMIIGPEQGSLEVMLRFTRWR